MPLEKAYLLSGCPLDKMVVMMIPLDEASCEPWNYNIVVVEI